jgi:hypothetical protein
VAGHGSLCRSRTLTQVSKPAAPRPHWMLNDLQTGGHDVRYVIEKRVPGVGQVIKDIPEGRQLASVHQLIAAGAFDWSHWSIFGGANQTFNGHWSNVCHFDIYHGKVFTSQRSPLFGCCLIFVIPAVLPHRSDFVSISTWCKGSGQPPLRERERLISEPSVGLFMSGSSWCSVLQIRLLDA